MRESKCVVCGKPMIVYIQQARFNNTCLQCRTERRERIESFILANHEIMGGVEMAHELGLSHNQVRRYCNRLEVKAKDMRRKENK